MRNRCGPALLLGLALAGSSVSGCGSEDSPGSSPTGTGGVDFFGSGGAGTGGAPGGRGQGGDSGTGASGSGGSVFATGGAPAAGGTAGGRGGAGPRTGGAGGGPGASGGAGGGGAGALSVPLDPALLSRCTGTNPIRCAIPVPTNGNYNVTVELGSATAASTSRVQAELLRVVVPSVVLGAGAYAQQTFSANVRAEDHDGYAAVGMILDVIVDGAAPALHGLGIVAAPNIPTIFVAGDSTVCDWDPAAANIISPIQRGWAQEISQYLRAGIAVANYADSGETASSFYSGFFGPAKNAMRAGDYLFIQFGHNDQKAPSDVTNYQANLMRYISDARTRNATPILFTPVARKGASTTDPGFMGLDQQARTLAAAQNVALVDLTSLAISYYRTVPTLAALFATPTEGTHFSEAGATQVANLVAATLKSGQLPLASFVK